MFIVASSTPLCAMPPVCAARNSAASLAFGMNVGFGFAVSCSVPMAQPRPNHRRRARNAMALSLDCITSTISVRLLQPNGQRPFTNRSGCRTISRSSISGRVSRVPLPVRGASRKVMKSPPFP